MKNTIFKITFGVFIACLLALALQSFSPSKAVEKEAEIVKVETVETDFGKAEMFFAVGGYVRANYRKDTIANTAADTIGLVSRTSTTQANANASYTPLLSLYSLDLSVVRANLSGTTTLAVYLDKSSTTTPTAGGWILVDSTSTATAGAAQIKISELTGEVYRIRIKGRGTQSSTYKIDCLLKKKN
jgi:hypothetical protein